MVRMPNKAETPARVQEIERRLRELFASADQSARTAQRSANTAQSTATTAQSTAVTAQSTAATAQAAATTAQTTAQTAQNTATTANTAAQTAQSAAQQASTDASAANTNAATAQAAAQSAQQRAQAALPTWQSFAPDNANNPGAADGQLWFVTNGTGGSTTAQYRWSAANSQWVLTPIDGTALRNVIADTVRAGAIDGQTITGAIYRSAGTGRRVEIQKTLVQFFTEDNVFGGSIYGAVDSNTGASVLTLGGANGLVTIGSNIPMACKFSTIGNRGQQVTSSYSTNMYQGFNVIGTVFARSYWMGSTRFIEEIPDPNNLKRGRVRGTFREIYYRDDDGDYYETPVLDRVPNDDWVPNRFRRSAHEVWARNTDGTSRQVISNSNNIVSVTSDVDVLQVVPSAAVPVNGTTDVTSKFNAPSGYGRIPISAWSNTDGFTVPAGMGGWWQLSLSIRSVAGGQAFLQLNGTYVAFQDGTNATLNTPLLLAAGDKVRLFMYSTSAANSAQAATRFTAIRMGTSAPRGSL